MIKIEIHKAKGKAKGQHYMVIVNGKQRLVNETVQNYRDCLKSAKKWGNAISSRPAIYDYEYNLIIKFAENGTMTHFRNMTKKEIAKA